MKKTAVITGATNGVGWALANNLARRGYNLVIPCRSLSRAEALRTAIHIHTPRAELDFIPCDLADLSAVAKCGQVIAERHPVIDLVVANAATVLPKKALTLQGVEQTFAVNHLAHFVLVQWLLGNLYTHSRLIFVASSGARWGRPAFLDDLRYQHQHYGMFRAYANSKLANIACAQQFAAQLQPRQIACMSVHPGMLATDLWPQRTVLQKLLIPLAKKLYFASPMSGAKVIEHLALAPEHNESRGFFDTTRPAPPPGAITPAFCQQLWQVSFDICRDFLPERAFSGYVVEC